MAAAKKEMPSADKYVVYKDNKKSKGYKKIHRWIPKSAEERVNRYLARINKEYEKSQA